MIREELCVCLSLYYYSITFEIDISLTVDVVRWISFIVLRLFLFYYYYYRHWLLSRLSFGKQIDRWLVAFYIPSKNEEAKIISVESTHT